MTAPLIRIAAPAVAEAISQLLDDVEHPLASEQVWGRIEHLRDAGGEVFLAEQERMVIGLAAVTLAPSLYRLSDTGHLSLLVVSQRVRSQGIGRALVDRFEQWAREKGCEAVDLTSHVRRTRAHSFYLGLGYEQNGVRFVRPLR
ncbi:MAG: N-acetyltransferase family protein [Caulobacteraceae bacterium]